MIDIFNIVLLVLSVVIGGGIVSLMDSLKQKKLIKIMLSFSGGFLLAMAFVHFLPELYESSNSARIGMFVLVGFLVQLFLEYFSGGIEHGHIHVHHNHKFPWALFISLSVHSFIEGIPLAGGDLHVENHGHLSGQSLLLGAIALMTLLKASGITSLKSWLYLLAFGIMTPLGLVFGSIFNVQTDNQYMSYLLAAVVGMFLHISTTIIFESSENHKFNFVKLLSIILGVVLAVSIA